MNGLLNKDIDKGLCYNYLEGGVGKLEGGIGKMLTREKGVGCKI